MLPQNQREMVSRFIDESRDKFNPVFFQRDEDDIMEQLMQPLRNQRGFH